MAFGCVLLLMLANSLFLSPTGSWTVQGCLLAALALLCPDFIRLAVAQLSGHRFTPATYSFGWVAFAFENLALSLGCNNMLLPKPDYPCILVNGSSGHVREVYNWDLSRLLKNFDNWAPQAVKTRLEEVLEVASKNDIKRAKSKGVKDEELPEPRKQAGLCVSVFNGSGSGVPVADWVYYSGILVTVIQLGISIIPWVYYGETDTGYITTVGMILACMTSSIPRWYTEKWGCPKNKKTTVLTRGNGAQHALVIVGDGTFSDFEILANLNPPMTILTAVYNDILAVMWLRHFYAVSAFKADPSFLLLIAVIGTLYNILCGELPRTPEALGLPLVLVEVIADAKVMDTLMLLEQRYPGVGASILKIFFPGKMTEEDTLWWASMATKLEAARKAEKLAKLAALEEKELPEPEAAELVAAEEPTST